MGIFLKKASLFDKVVQMLEQVPEIVECHYTTGQYAIFIKIYAQSNEHLKRILHDKLQSIPGISSTETIISLDESFKRQLPIERSEEHTSELQSRPHLVCRLLLEKKKQII